MADTHNTTSGTGRRIGVRQSPAVPQNLATLTPVERQDFDTIVKFHILNGRTLEVAERFAWALVQTIYTRLLEYDGVERQWEQ